MFMINDEGIWLLRRPWEREAMEIFKEIPPRWEDRSEDDWLAYANAVKRKVYDQRFEFPREWPFYLGWNAQHSNAPGHDVLPARRRQHAPVHQRAADPALRAARARRRCSWTTGARSGPRARRSGSRGPRPRSALVDPIPYQPIGGIKRVRGGLVTPDTPAPHRQRSATVRTDHEAYFLMQNLMLRARRCASAAGSTARR